MEPEHSVIKGLPYTYNGKSGNWHLFLCYSRYFDKILLKCFWSTNHINFVQIIDFDWCPWQPKG